MTKIDVLAVMDELIDVPVIECEDDQLFVDHAKEARAAVAELINTANRVWSKGGAVTGGEWDELGNALSRIGGAP